MLERGFLPDFSAAVLVETDTIGKPAEADLSLRDLPSLPWVPIDNDDSRDLDQLSVAVPMPGGTIKILVAVADVDAIVKRGSAIDGHAGANTTSVYTRRVRAMGIRDHPTAPRSPWQNGTCRAAYRIDSSRIP